MRDITICIFDAFAGEHAEQTRCFVFITIVNAYIFFPFLPSTKKHYYFFIDRFAPSRIDQTFVNDAELSRRSVLIKINNNELTTSSFFLEFYSYQ
jgi:hypothetical protein